MNITACLITWKRPENINLIKKDLAKYSFIDEILVRDHDNTLNIINYGRYVLAKKAKNDAIYLQDDDWIIGDIEKIYKAYCKQPDKLINGGPQEYLDIAKKENIYGDAQMAMVGWGSMLDKKYIKVLDKYIEKYGQDYCFFRETDRILSMLMNQHHVMIKTKLERLEGAVGKYALCNQDDHLEYKELAIKRCLDLL